jgi:sugar/nucleoside kinase (ribokinase family)
MKDVITIGSIVRDLFWEIELPIIKWKGTESGKALVFPLGEKYGAKNIFFCIGGNAANAATTFARQGLKTGIFSLVGGDIAGKENLRLLKNEGVDTTLVGVDNKKETATSTIFIQAGERSILTYHGVMNEFAQTKIDFENLLSRWWYLSLSANNHLMFDSLMSYAIKKSISVAVNPTHNQLVGEGKRDLLKNLKYLSLLIVNDEEAAMLAGISFKKNQERTIFKKLSKLTSAIIVITLGPKGSLTFYDGRIYKAGIFQNKKIIDRTGAGDAFGSGLTSILIKNNIDFSKIKNKNVESKNIEEAIRFASANATSVVEYIGAQPGILTGQDFLSKRWQDLPIEKYNL